MMNWFFFYKDITKRTDEQGWALEELVEKLKKENLKIILANTNEYGRLICTTSRYAMKIQDQFKSQCGKDVYIECNAQYVITPKGEILPGGIIP